MLQFGGYLLRFHLASCWLQNNKHSRNFLWCSQFYGKDCKWPCSPWEQWHNDSLYWYIHLVKHSLGLYWKIFITCSRQTGLKTPWFILTIAVVSKQPGNSWSSAGYLIVCCWLLCSQQSARYKQARRCLLSLRQHSNFTLSFAAIIHMRKDASVVLKKLKSCFVAKWPGQPCLGIWWHGRFFSFFRLLPADSMAEKRKHETVNTLFSFGFKRSWSSSRWTNKHLAIT